jgi:hypothetical protein
MNLSNFRSKRMDVFGRTSTSRAHCVVFVAVLPQFVDDPLSQVHNGARQLTAIATQVVIPPDQWILP